MTQGITSVLNFDPVRIHKARAMLDYWARLAREDAGMFFELVIRHETKRTPLRLAEHQKVALSFLLHHKRAGLIMPIRHSKTWLAACLTLWLLGRNPSLRGAIVSATQDQAAKVLGMVSDYITNSPQLRLVFPHLRPTQRSREPWTQIAITVDRPPGIRDASLKAIGLDGAIAGSRLDWIVIDDVLNQENTMTLENCKKTIAWLDSSVLTRLEPSPETRVLGINTPWNPQDAIHELERRGWAMMRMSVDGTIRVQDDVEEAIAAKEQGRVYEPWDHPGIIPGSDNLADMTLRLKEHPHGSSLWPEIYTPPILRALKRGMPIHEWNRAFMCTATSDEEAMCKLEYIETCKAVARRLKVSGLVAEWPESTLAINAIDRKQAALAVFTGVDLAFKMGQQHDLTAFFTFAVLPDGRRRILDIETGRFPGPAIVEKCVLKHKQFGGVIVVEDVGAQSMLLPFIRKRDLSIPIRPYTTTAIGKANPVYGVATVFTEMANGAWIIPNDEHGLMHPEVRKFVDACLQYTPDTHVADVLMACVEPGSLVTTSRGLVPIEEVRTDDRVLTHRGRWQRVTGVTVREHSGEACRIKPRGGLPFVVTPEHPIWSTTARFETEIRTNRVIVNDAEWEFRKAAELRVGSLTSGHLMLNPVARGWNGEEPDPVLEVPGHHSVGVDEEFAMLLGLYLAEGSIGGERHMVSLALHEREEHLVEFFRDVMRRKFDVNVSMRRANSEKGIIASTSVRRVVDIFAAMGSRSTKRMPWEWMRWPSQLREHVVRGWFMGDGCCTIGQANTKLSAVSISRGLIEQMRMTLWQRGYLATTGVFEKGGWKRVFGYEASKVSPAWKVSLMQLDTLRFLGEGNDLEREHWGTMAPRGQRTVRTNTPMHLHATGIATKATSIERIAYDGPVHNLHVEEDESYCVEGIAVHNCFFAREQARKWGLLTPEQKEAQSLASVLMR